MKKLFLFIIILSSFSSEQSFAGMTCESLFEQDFTQVQIDQVIQELYGLRRAALNSDNRKYQISKNLFAKKMTELQKIIPPLEIEKRLKAVKNDSQFAGFEEATNSKKISEKNIILNFLIEREISSIDGFDRNGHPPLIAAIVNNRFDVAQALINAKIGLETKDHGWQERTPLGWAVFERNSDIVKLLLDANVPLEDQTIDGITPLLSASRTSNIELVQLLLERGANANAIDVNGNNALYACDENIVKILIDNNTDINYQNLRGQTPLHHAARFGYLKIVEVLISSHANMEIKDSKGMTPLLQALDKKQYDIASFLIKSGANVNVEDKNGRTPLMIVSKRAQKMVQLLIKAGATR
jgi:ankyrin repeat protein